MTDRPLGRPPKDGRTVPAPVAVVEHRLERGHMMLTLIRLMWREVGDLGGAFA